MGLRKIKNILIILITALLLSAVSLAIIGNVGKKENDNSSAASAIYSIYNFNDFKQFRDSVNGGNNYDNKTINLYANINMNNESWDPIGSSQHRFAGTFNGNNNTIYNYAGGGGVFGMIVTDATIKNLTVIANNAGAGIVH